MQRTTYSIYGIRLPDDTDGHALEELTGQCTNDGAVGVFWAGAHDRDMTFLALRWTEIEPGNYVYHSGDGPNASRFTREQWNSQLRDAAARLGVEIVEGPGWFTIPDES